MLGGRFAQVMEALSMLLIVVGIFCLCQPWWFPVYQRGFSLLLAGVVGLTFFSHRRPVKQ